MPQRHLLPYPYKADKIQLMTSLKEENDKLKAENEKLKQENEELQKRISQFIDSRHCQLSSAHPTLYLGRMHYSDRGARPHMVMNGNAIFFESRNDKTAQLAKIICCKENLFKLADGPVPIDEIYDWYDHSESWFNISHEEREQFKKNLYQWTRRLNDKWAIYSGKNKLFLATKTEFGFDPRFIIEKTIPKL